MRRRNLHTIVANSQLDLTRFEHAMNLLIEGDGEWEEQIPSSQTFCCCAISEAARSLGTKCIPSIVPERAFFNLVFECEKTNFVVLDAALTGAPPFGFYTATTIDPRFAKATKRLLPIRLMALALAHTLAEEYNNKEFQL